MNVIRTITESQATPDIISVVTEDLSTRHTVRAVIFDSKNRVAILGVSKFNFYTIPGGGVDEGEDYVEAVMRECREESGCDIQIMQEIGIIIEQQPHLNRTKISYCYLARKLPGELPINLTAEETEEQYALQWVDIERAILLTKNSQTTNYKGRFIKIRDSIFLEKAWALYKEKGPAQ